MTGSPFDDPERLAETARMGTVHHVFPYDPGHLGVTLDQWWSGQLQRWPLAAVASSRRAADTTVHVISDRNASLGDEATTTLRLQVHRTLYSNARLHRWGDDWSLSLGRALSRTDHNDLVVVHLDGYAAARLCFRYSHNAKCVLVLHGRGTGSAEDHAASDLTVVLNDDTRDRLIERGIASERLLAMVPSIDRELFAPAGGPLPGSPPILGYVGRIEKSKGVLELPQIVRTLADLDVRLECVGSALSPDARQRAEHAFAGLPVDLTGELSPSRVAARMQHWSALLLPSYTEGMPLVALEALSSGIPVIAVEGVLPRTLAERRGVWVGPRESIAERARAALASDQGIDAAWIPGHRQGGENWDAVYDSLPTWQSRFRPSARPLFGRLKRMKLSS